MTLNHKKWIGQIIIFGTKYGYFHRGNEMLAHVRDRDSKRHSKYFKNPRIKEQQKHKNNWELWSVNSNFAKCLSWGKLKNGPIELKLQPNPSLNHICLMFYNPSFPRNAGETSWERLKMLANWWNSWWTVTAWWKLLPMRWMWTRQGCAVGTIQWPRKSRTSKQKAVRKIGSQATYANSNEINRTFGNWIWAKTHIQ